MIRDAENFQSLLDATRAFVRDVAIPNEDRVEAEDKVPDDAIQAMRDLGADVDQTRVDAVLQQQYGTAIAAE